MKRFVKGIIIAIVVCFVVFAGGITGLLIFGTTEAPKPAVSR
jgi:hypothetical protein